jgi:hypothetical protein
MVVMMGFYWEAENSYACCCGLGCSLDLLIL